MFFLITNYSSNIERRNQLLPDLLGRAVLPAGVPCCIQGLASKMEYLIDYLCSHKPQQLYLHSMGRAVFQLHSLSFQSYSSPTHGNFRVWKGRVSAICRTFPYELELEMDTNHWFGDSCKFVYWPNRLLQWALESPASSGGYQLTEEVR